MSRHLFIRQHGHTTMLEKLSNTYHLEKILQNKYFPKEPRLQSLLQDQITGYQKKINYYFNLLSISDKKRKKIANPENIAKPVDKNSNIHEIATKASSYFQQGLEMYLTSMTMNINSSPLVEYYSILQCIKGRILLDLEINEEVMFSNHGIVSDKANQNTKYVRTSVKPFGVFQSLLLVESTSTEINEYLMGQKNISLLEIMNKTHYFSPNDMTAAFMVSWMLSTLVRYNPTIWQQIYFGVDNDDIFAINKYRRDDIPNALNRMLTYPQSYTFLKDHDPINVI